jgi:Flp pilus assembly protein TadD
MSVMLAQAQRSSGDTDGAEATAKSLLAAHPDDVRATYLMAQMLEAKGRYQEMVDLLKPAIARLRASSSRTGTVAMLLATEGIALQQLKRTDEAMAVLKDAASMAPDDTTVMFQLGAVLDRAGRHAEAEKAFRDVIAKDPLDANALNYLGYMLAERGGAGTDESRRVHPARAQGRTRQPSYLDSLGWAYFQQGKIDLADTPLSTAAGKLPKNSVIQDHLGDLRLKQRRPDEAIAAWQRALEGTARASTRRRSRRRSTRRASRSERAGVLPPCRRLRPVRRRRVRAEAAVCCRPAPAPRSRFLVRVSTGHRVVPRRDDAHGVDGDVGQGGEERSCADGSTRASPRRAAPGLEGIPPFGKPVFVLVADQGKGTLVLTRGRSRSCATRRPRRSSKRSRASRWRRTICGRSSPAAVRRGGVGRPFVPQRLDRRTHAGRSPLPAARGRGWEVAAATRGGIIVTYEDYAAGRPRRSAYAPSRAAPPRPDLTLRLSDVALNTTLDPKTFDITADLSRASRAADARRVAPRGPLGGVEDRGSRIEDRKTAQTVNRDREPQTANTHRSRSRQGEPRPARARRAGRWLSRAAHRLPGDRDPRHARVRARSRGRSR